MQHYLIRYLPIIFAWIYVSYGFSQFYQTGQDPASVKWEQINTPGYKIIFDEQFRDKAQNIANILEYSSQYIDNTLQSDLKTFPVVIHSHSTYANGMVVLAPSRMELYSTPGQNIYSQAWLEQLVLHENRHVAQTSKMWQGITKVGSFVAGEQVAGAVIGLVPLWFLEGDAVATETALSNAGRGRMPSFEMDIRTLALSKSKSFSYYKAFYGSYKDYVPNHYQYGYQLVSYGREKYGSELFNYTLDKVAKKPFLVFPFYAGLKKYAGLSKRDLYFYAMEKRDSAWTLQDKSIKPTAFKTLHNEIPTDYVNYRFPVETDSETYIAEKYGPGYYRQFVTLSADGEEKLFTPGFLTPVKLSASGSVLVWAEEVADPRWEHRNYSVIKKLDTQTGLVTWLTRKSRYFAPDISTDGSRIIAVEITKDNTHYLTILDAINGDVLSRNPIPENRMPLFPVWNDTDTAIAVILLQNKGKSISIFDPSLSSWQEVKKPTFENITQLHWKDKYLYFRSGKSGIPNVHALNSKTGAEYQVTSSRFGSFDPTVSADGKNLVYANYTIDGFRVVKTEIDTSTWIPYAHIKNTSIKTYKPLVEQENSILEPGDIPSLEYPVKKYSRTLNLFRFHSWSPFYFDYNELQITDPAIYPGLTLLSQNTLSTAFTTLGYAWRNNAHYVSTRFTYRGQYPVFELSSTYGSRPQVLNLPQNKNLAIKNDGLTYSGRVFLPLNFRQSMMITSFIPSFEYSYSNSHRFTESGDYYRGRSTNELGMLFYSYLKLAQRDIAPRAGFLSNIRYLATPGDNDFGDVFNALGRIYIPGILPHHSLIFEGSAQRQNTENYYVSGYASLPRGYSFAFSEELTRFTTEYYFPIWYPDFALWQILYVKRFKARLFYDYGKGDFLTRTASGIELRENSLSSSGMELTMDFHAAQVIFPFNAGIRTIYMHESKAFLTEGIFTIDLGVF